MLWHAHVSEATSSVHRAESQWRKWKRTLKFTSIGVASPKGKTEELSSRRSVGRGVRVGGKAHKAEGCCSELNRELQLHLTITNAGSFSNFECVEVHHSCVFRAVRLVCRSPAMPALSVRGALFLCAFVQLFSLPGGQVPNCQEVRAVFQSLHPGSKWVPENPVSGKCL